MNCPVLLFDGVCNFCNSVVNFIIRHDKTGNIRFASLQSPAGKGLLAEGLRAKEEQDSFVLIHSGRIYTRSSAALQVARLLRFPWCISYIFIVIPSSLRDGAYNLIARNRYRWFGKRASCTLPPFDVKGRFLD